MTNQYAKTYGESKVAGDFSGHVQGFEAEKPMHLFIQ